jgi:hypothetical protein
MLALSLFEWFRRAKPNLTTGEGATDSGTGFSRAMEIIPGELRMKIFFHGFPYEHEGISCWSYVTEGLAAHKQKEIIFTLRVGKDQKFEDFPTDFCELFALIYGHAKRGELVDAGGVTLLGENGFLGRKDFRGIGYVTASGFHGLEMGGVPPLAGIMLKGDEAQVAWNLGMTRMIGLLGKKYRYYPCPNWSDLEREPVVSLQSMMDGLLANIGRVSISGSYYEKQKHIYLSLQRSSRSNLVDYLRQVPPTMALALKTQPDPRANACLVWSPGQTQTMAITPLHSDGSRKTGAFLAFIPEQAEVDVRAGEDGCCLLLTNISWLKIREALLRGDDFYLPLAAPGGASISIGWSKTEYTSPVSGEVYIAEGWTTYYPERGSPSKEHVAISAVRIVLLTSEQDMQARTTGEDLAGYSNLLEKAVDTVFTALEPRTHREIVIQVAMTSTGREVQFIAKPELGADVAKELRARLEKVKAPRVGGAVKFEMLLTVWGISRNQ